MKPVKILLIFGLAGLLGAGLFAFLGRFGAVNKISQLSFGLFVLGVVFSLSRK